MREMTEKGEERTSGSFGIDSSFDGRGETEHGVFGGSFVESELGGRIEAKERDQRDLDERREDATHFFELRFPVSEALS